MNALIAIGNPTYFFLPGLFLLLVLTALALIKMRNLLASAALFSIFSLLMALTYLLLQAPDVAITEAAVGAGVSTLFLLMALPHTRQSLQLSSIRVSWPALMLVCALGLSLFFATIDLPNFGNLHSPAQRHLAFYYLNNAAREIGIPNVVTAILASYRGYDTLGEVTVVFVALISVAMLLVNNKNIKIMEKKMQKGNFLQAQIILSMVTKWVLPFIFLFSFYLLLHGENSAGGGFQAGVLFATALILYALVFGISAAMHVIPLTYLMRMAAWGIGIYGGVGIAGLMAGGHFLDYSSLSETPHIAQFWSVLLVEIGIGVSVAGAMAALFMAFADFSAAPESQDKGDAL